MVGINEPVNIETSKGYVADLSCGRVLFSRDNPKTYRNRHVAENFIARHADKGRGLDSGDLRIVAAVKK